LTGSWRARSLGHVPRRCAWVPEGDALYLTYHDEEWGSPQRNDDRLYELLVLEGAQAGLSWATILRKREGYRRAFAGFDPEAVARFDARRVDGLLADAGIVRNRLKIESAVENAKRVLEVQAERGSFAEFLWDFVDGKPTVAGWNSISEIPAETPTSRAMSKELKRRGFRFVGPTVCYAFMQAAGLVNDHVVGCFRYEELAGATPS
jgi:DNA-3-methyladenine glycosylase I